MDDYWQAEQHRDELLLQAAAKAALLASRARPLTPAEIMAVAALGGIANDIEREIQL